MQNHTFVLSKHIFMGKIVFSILQVYLEHPPQNYGVFKTREKLFMNFSFPIITWHSKHAYKIEEWNLTSDNRLTQNKTVILHILVK